ncbi:MAG: GAF domain-containing protein [Tissierellia bacterium]|nr:GAF domain-containing protein [Tissierellia bacterium]
MDYNIIIKMINEQIKNETDDMANLSNIISIIFNNVEDLNWVGLYFKKDDLVLGPFNGKPACTRLKDKGVCVKAFKENKTIVIEDVNKEQDHIFCDTNSKSEICTVIKNKDKTIGVFDIDSPVVNRFKKDEIEFFEDVTEILNSNIDFSKFI